ncbi:Hypothetical protein PHPALM_14045 [Phytophthora palmivora]|uniref:FLYWCH-type domain-containing protein n=1 Tax=Phytophthora palmivora TaxID=4796 RepID=A0A2P4XVR8_9STRA|nr:Hypothetical protein PHPALM_14045 [Phytophthora palmivora]
MPASTQPTPLNTSASSIPPTNDRNSISVRRAAASKTRDGETKRYFQGFECTRANATSVKITYRCSFYRKPKLCPGMLVFNAASMTYDFDNMVPHTCQNGAAVGHVSGNPACGNLIESMQKFVDELVEQDLPAKTIWPMAYEKFYSNSSRVLCGLSRRQVLNRVANAKAVEHGSLVWQYFGKTWLETYPPDLWNIYGVRRQIVNRTNNPLERFHRELNARMKAHPTLKRFVRVIENIAREYVVLRRSIISGDATAPVRPNLRFPRVTALPNIEDIEDSDSDDYNDADHVNSDSDADYQLSSDELDILYDTSFDYEEFKEI